MTTGISIIERAYANDRVDADATRRDLAAALQQAIEAARRERDAIERGYGGMADRAAAAFQEARGRVAQIVRELQREPYDEPEDEGDGTSDYSRSDRPEYPPPACPWNFYLGGD